MPHILLGADKTGMNSTNKDHRPHGTYLALTPSAVVLQVWPLASSFCISPELLEMQTVRSCPQAKGIRNSGVGPNSVF